MALENHYYYNEETCEFMPVQYSKAERIVYNFSIWLITGVILAGVGIMLLSKYFGSPAELALKAENELLYSQLEATKSTITKLDEELKAIAETDNELYRSVLGMEDISYDERAAGIGGADTYSDFDLYSEPTSKILRWTAEKLDNLERRIQIQKLSFEELKDAYNTNKESLKHLPAIKPTAGIITSGFGLRDHPVLGFKRKHNGLDFRADVGTPVYATADGSIRYAGIKGNLGRVVIVEHGYGYETVYAHLSSYPKEIKVGAKVIRGQNIAFSGDTGMSKGPHLHYEVYFNGQPVDPLNYLFADISPEEYLMYMEVVERNTESMD